MLRTNKFYTKPIKSFEKLTTFKKKHIIRITTKKYINSQKQQQNQTYFKVQRNANIL